MWGLTKPVDKKQLRDTVAAALTQIPG